MTISFIIEREPMVGTSRKSIFVLLRNDTPALAYRRLEVPLVPVNADAQTYFQAHYTLQQAWDAGTDISAQQAWISEQTPLVQYYASILKSLYNDVDNTGMTIDQLLTNAAVLVAANPTQAAKFAAYRTRLGLGGAINSLTAAQKGQLLVLGLEWAAAGLAAANTINDPA